MEQAPLRSSPNVCNLVSRLRLLCCGLAFGAAGCALELPEPDSDTPSVRAGATAGDTVPVTTDMAMDTTADTPPVDAMVDSTGDADLTPKAPQTCRDLLKTNGATGVQDI